jgi:hypothetical protein
MLLVTPASGKDTGQLNGDGWHNQISPFIEKILK